MFKLTRLLLCVIFFWGSDEYRAAEVKNYDYSLFTSLDHSQKVTSSTTEAISISSSMVVIGTSSTASLTPMTLSKETVLKSGWLTKTSVSRMPSHRYLPFVRYERSEMAYRPYFEDILYFSCEAWVPDYLEDLPEVLLAEQARSILINYYVVPQAEWLDSYPSSGDFSHYAQLKFPDDIYLKLLVHEAGVAIILYPDGGAVFLSKNLYDYQIELAKRYKFRLRTDDI